MSQTFLRWVAFSMLILIAGCGRYGVLEAPATVPLEENIPQEELHEDEEKSDDDRSFILDPLL